MDLTAKLKLVDDLERAFERCTHPNISTGLGWCNVCGAVKMPGQWIKPHWRDIIVRAVFHKNEL